MKKVAIIIGALLLSGCGATATGNYREVNCTAKYNLKTFVVAGDADVNISAMRENRFGKKYLRLSVYNRQVQFYNRWQPAEYFTNLRCE